MLEHTVCTVHSVVVCSMEGFTFCGISYIWCVSLWYCNSLAAHAAHVCSSYTFKCDSDIHNIKWIDGTTSLCHARKEKKRLKNAMRWSRKYWDILMRLLWIKAIWGGPMCRCYFQIKSATLKMAVIRQDICLQFIKWIFMSAVPYSIAFFFFTLLFCPCSYFNRR